MATSALWVLRHWISYGSRCDLFDLLELYSGHHYYMAGMAITIEKNVGCGSKVGK